MLSAYDFLKYGVSLWKPTMFGPLFRSAFSYRSGPGSRTIHTAHKRRGAAMPHQNGREIARRAAQSAAGKLAFVPLKANGTDKGKGFARAAWPWRSALRAGGA